MKTTTNVIAIEDKPIEKLKTCISLDFINANSVALAVLSWITGITLTEARIAELLTTSDGSVTIRYADETMAHRLCSLPEFLVQVSQLCVELGLSVEEAQSVVTQVKGRLTSR